MKRTHVFCGLNFFVGIDYTGWACHRLLSPHMLSSFLLWVRIIGLTEPLDCSFNNKIKQLFSKKLNLAKMSVYSLSNFRLAFLHSRTPSPSFFQPQFGEFNFFRLICSNSCFPFGKSASQLYTLIKQNLMFEFLLITLR